MKKLATLVSAVALLGMTVVGCGTASNNSNGSSSGSSNTGTSGGSSSQLSMVVGTDPTFAPFETQKNGNITGFDIDLINDIAKVENIKIKEIRKMQFTGLIPALTSDSVDVAVAGITIKTSRMKSVNFSNAYYLSGLSILVKKGSNIKGLSDLKNRVVAAKKGTTSVDLLKQNNITKVKQYDNTSDMYSALESGGVDAVVFDNPSNVAFAQGHSNVQTVGGLLTGEYYGIAVSKKKPKLLAAINDGLQKVQANGEYKSLFDKYFGGDTNGMVKGVKKPADVAVNN